MIPMRYRLGPFWSWIMPDKATGSQDSQNWLLLVLNHPIFSDPIMKAAPVGLKIRAFQKKTKFQSFRIFHHFTFLGHLGSHQLPPLAASARRRCGAQAARPGIGPWCWKIYQCPKIDPNKKVHIPYMEHMGYEEWADSWIARRKLDLISKNRGRCDYITICGLLFLSHITIEHRHPGRAQTWHHPNQIILQSYTNHRHYSIYIYIEI
jgi:hypothetical protein